MSLTHVADGGAMIQKSAWLLQYGFSEIVPDSHDKIQLDPKAHALLHGCCVDEAPAVRVGLENRSKILSTLL